MKYQLPQDLNAVNQQLGKGSSIFYFLVTDESSDAWSVALVAENDKGVTLVRAQDRKDATQWISDGKLGAITNWKGVVAVQLTADEATSEDTVMNAITTASKAK